MPATNIITLENDQLRARFNAENGALLSLTNRATGWELLRREALALSFRMEVPLPERHMNYIHGERQTLARYEVSADGARVTFHWQTLHSEYGGEHAIGFTGVVTLERDGLLFTGTVDNRSELTVEAVCYPCLGDLTPPPPR